MEFPSYRHGDVGLFGIAQLPANAKRVEVKGDIVLALGEVTGHAHRIKSKRVSLWEADGQRYVTVEEALPGEAPAALDHEEHGHIPLAPGTYRAMIQRVYSPAGIQQVAD